MGKRCILLALQLNHFSHCAVDELHSRENEMAIVSYEVLLRDVLVVSVVSLKNDNRIAMKREEFLKDIRVCVGLFTEH